VLLQFHASMALAAGLLFYAAILGDGNEFQKHLFVFNFLFDGCLVADVLWFTEGFSSITRSVRAWSSLRVFAATLMVCAAGLGLYLQDRWSARSTLPAGRSVVGYLDQAGGRSILSIPPNGEMHVSGWAACVDPAASLIGVEVMVDYVTVAKATTSDRRLDVVQTYERPDLINSGWEAAFRLRGLAPGDHPLGVLVTCTKGIAGTLPPLHIRVSR